MKTHSFKKYGVPVMLCLLLVTAFAIGCGDIDDSCKAKYEKTQNLSAPLAPGQTLELQNNVGKIIIIGSDVENCNVTAVITAKAETEEQAQKLAEEVQIKLQSNDDKLNIKIEQPADKSKHLTIDLNITVPKETALQLAADVGEINISNITKSIKAETDVGAITCTEITGDLDINTDVGEVKIIYSKAAAGACNANIETDVGEISFTAPPDFSARVDFSTNLGTIETDLPLNIKGMLGKQTNGTVGNGEGRITLKTNIGSIKIS